MVEYYFLVALMVIALAVVVHLFIEHSQSM